MFVNMRRRLWLYASPILLLLAPATALFVAACSAPTCEVVPLGGRFLAGVDGRGNPVAGPVCRSAITRLLFRGESVGTAAVLSEQGLMVSAYAAIGNVVDAALGGLECGQGFCAEDLGKEVVLSGVSIERETPAELRVGALASEAVAGLASFLRPSVRAYSDVRLVYLGPVSAGELGSGVSAAAGLVSGRGRVVMLRAYEDGAPAVLEGPYMHMHESMQMSGSMEVLCPCYVEPGLRLTPAAAVELSCNVMLPLHVADLRAVLAAADAARGPGVGRAVGEQLVAKELERLQQLQRMCESMHVVELRRRYEMRWECGLVGAQRSLFRMAREAATAAADRLCVLLPRRFLYDLRMGGSIERGMLVARALDEQISERGRAAARDKALAFVVGYYPGGEAYLKERAAAARRWLGSGDPLLDWFDEVADPSVEGSMTEVYRRLTHSELRSRARVSEYLSSDQGRDAWNRSEDLAVVLARIAYRLEASVLSQIATARADLDSACEWYAAVMTGNASEEGRGALKSGFAVAMGRVATKEEWGEGACGRLWVGMDALPGCIGAVLCDAGGRGFAIVVGEDRVGGLDDIAFSGMGRVVALGWANIVGHMRTVENARRLSEEIAGW